MTDWRQEHRRELVEKQRHISQKLAQLREFRRLVRKWDRNLRQLRNWFAGLETSASRSKWFSVTSLTRMASIAGSLQQMIGEFEQVGDPKAIGTGTTTTGASRTTASASTSASPSSGPATASGVNAGQLTAWLSSRAGPLASLAPWELAPTFDPATAESVRQGKYGAAVTNAIFSPFTSLSAVGFAEETFKMSLELIEQHESEFEDLEKGWKDARDGLDTIIEALGGVDHEALEALEQELADVLRDYERTYDGALGTGPNAQEIRAQAETPTRTPSDAEVEAWDAQLEARTAELDRALEEGNDYDPSTDPDLAGLDDLPGLDD